MFMRFVQLKLDPERIPEFHKVYDERVIPAFHATPGCLYASLIQSIDQPGECISMTLWDKQQSAEAYEHGGMYARLMEGVTAFLADTSEWKVHLSKDLTLEYEQVTEEPVIQAYQVAVQDSSKSIPTENALFVRIVVPQIREGKEVEFQQLYNENVLPVLRTIKGCRYVYLTKSASEPNKLLSVTIWETKLDADTYEQSGIFQQLTDKLRHTLSDVYQWKMQLQNNTQSEGVSSDNLAVEGYTVVTGKNFL
jgi:quinol monooxygenase YgiN